MHVVRHKLEVPFQLAGIGIEGDGGIRIQVIAGPDVAVPIGRWIAHAPDNQVLRRVVSARHPGGSATAFPGVAAPAFAARLAGFRNGPEAPAAFAGFQIVGIEETANAVFAARNAGDHHVLDDQRRAREAVAVLRFGHLHIPQHRTGLGVQRHQVRVHCAHDHAIAHHRHAPVHLPAASIDLVRQTAAIAPVGPAGGGVQGHHIRWWLAQVHHSIDHQRRSFDALRDWHLVNPGNFQLVDIGAIHLIE